MLHARLLVLHKPPYLIPITFRSPSDHLPLTFHPQSAPAICEALEILQHPKYNRIIHQTTETQTPPKKERSHFQISFAQVITFKPSV